MKTYKFEVIIEEGNDEFWESIQGKTGCDEMLEVVKDLFNQEAWDAEIKLVEYKDGNEKSTTIKRRKI